MKWYKILIAIIIVFLFVYIIMWMDVLENALIQAYERIEWLEILTDVGGVIL